MGTNIDRYFHHLSIGCCSLVSRSFPTYAARRDLIFSKMQCNRYILYICCIASSNRSSRTWQHKLGSFETCCIGHCSCKQNFEKKGKLLKNLIICLAFQISALGFFHGSTEYERIAQFCHGTREMSVKKNQPTLQNQKKDWRHRELVHSSCVSLGRGWHTQSRAKSSWSSSHYVVVAHRWRWLQRYWQVINLY